MVARCAPAYNRRFTYFGTGELLAKHSRYPTTRAVLALSTMRRRMRVPDDMFPPETSEVFRQ